MRDLDVNTATFADIDRLGHGLEHIVRLISYMRGVARAVPLQHVTERADFLGLRVQAGRREQACRHTERARGQGLVEHLLHMLQLAVIRRPVVHTHRHQTQGVVPNLHHRVDRDLRPRLHIASEVGFAEGQPWRAR